MLTTLDRLDYMARQGARVAWFLGHYLAARRYRPAAPQEEAKPAPPRPPGPGLAEIFEAMGVLFARDLANAERGFYPLPRDHDGSLKNLIETSRRFFADLPVAARRKAEQRATDVHAADLTAGLPAYFLQNFHFQTGGYLTRESARLYDMQVEVLFSGTANAMRRQCLKPIAEFLKGKDQRRLSLLDVACGTGRFVRLAKQAFPRLGVTGGDLSSAYLDEARAHVQPYRAEFRQAKAEALPFPDAAFDLVTSIFLFHEVPPAVRREISSEFARVLKPGGRLIFMDSLQLGDVPAFDGMLEGFPRNFHEPYYASYLSEDLPTLFAAAGLETMQSEPVFLSKLLVADKPLADLAAVPQEMVGQHEGQHGLADGHGADADAGVVAAGGRNIGVLA